MHQVLRYDTGGSECHSYIADYHVVSLRLLNMAVGNFPTKSGFSFVGRSIVLDTQKSIFRIWRVIWIEPFIDDVVYMRKGKAVLKGSADKLREEKKGSLSDIFEEVVE